MKYYKPGWSIREKAASQNPLWLKLFITLILISIPSNSSSESQTVQQKTTGNQSPVIHTGPNSKVAITYGISQETYKELKKELKGKDKVIERLLKTLNEKDVAIEKRDATILELAKKYKELEERLAERSKEDTLFKQARKRLDEGDIEGAERLLKNH